MAQMLESVITIKASKLVPDISNERSDVLSGDIVKSIEEIVTELAGEGVLVEVFNETARDLDGTSE